MRSLKHAFLALVAVGIAFSAATAAAAATVITGTWHAAVNGEVYESVNFGDVGRGRWTVEFEFSSRASGGLLTWGEYRYNYYTITPPVREIEGNEENWSRYTVITNPTTAGHLHFDVAEEKWTRLGANLIYRDYEVFDGATFNLKFQNGGPVQYTLTVRPASPVPEPQIWALMITGFGLAGAALRGRHRSSAAT